MHLYQLKSIFVRHFSPLTHGLKRGDILRVDGAVGQRAGIQEQVCVLSAGIGQHVHHLPGRLVLTVG
jgi:hypothetical protein